MRKLFVVLGLVLLAGLPAQGQDKEFPRAEIYGGFSYASVDTRDLESIYGIPVGRTNALGFGTQVAGNINKYFGLVFDFSGHFKSRTFTDPVLGSVTAKTKAYTFMAGPRITARSDKATAFLHALVGGAKFNTGLPSDIPPAFGAKNSDNGFAWAVGGGVDVNAGNKVAIRIIQVDYLSSKLLFSTVPGVSAPRQHNFRIGGGIVFRLGGGS